MDSERTSAVFGEDPIPYFSSYTGTFATIFFTGGRIPNTSTYLSDLRFLPGQNHVDDFFIGSVSDGGNEGVEISRRSEANFNAGDSGVYELRVDDYQTWTRPLLQTITVLHAGVDSTLLTVDVTVRRSDASIFSVTVRAAHEPLPIFTGTWAEISMHMAGNPVATGFHLNVAAFDAAGIPYTWRVIEEESSRDYTVALLRDLVNDLGGREENTGLVVPGPSFMQQYRGQLSSHSANRISAGDYGICHRVVAEAVSSADTGSIVSRVTAWLITRGAEANPSLATRICRPGTSFSSGVKTGWNTRIPPTEEHPAGSLNNPYMIPDSFGTLNSRILITLTVSGGQIGHTAPGGGDATFVNALRPSQACTIRYPSASPRERQDLVNAQGISFQRPTQGVTRSRELVVSIAPRSQATRGLQDGTSTGFRIIVNPYGDDRNSYDESFDDFIYFSYESTAGITAEALRSCRYY